MTLTTEHDKKYTVRATGDSMDDTCRRESYCPCTISIFHRTSYSNNIQPDLRSLLSSFLEGVDEVDHDACALIHKQIDWRRGLVLSSLNVGRARG